MDPEQATQASVARVVGLGARAHAPVLRRMSDRGFSELDLRRMLGQATAYRIDVAPQRFIVGTRRSGGPWEVIVEPDEASHLLVVVTAYPSE